MDRIYFESALVRIERSLRTAAEDMPYHYKHYVKFADKLHQLQMSDDILATIDKVAADDKEEELLWWIVSALKP